MTFWGLEKKLSELDNMRDELQKTIKELKEGVKSKTPHPRWIPKEDEQHYMITGSGRPDIWTWRGNTDDGTSIGRYNLGNVFRTKAEAEFAAEYLRVLAEMREWAGKWDDEFNLRYSEASGVEIFTQSLPEKSYGEMRFATKEDAQNCIIMVGEERIKKYYFMIPE